MAFLDFFRKNTISKGINSSLHDENTGLSNVKNEQIKQIPESKDRPFMGKSPESNSIMDMIYNMRWGQNSFNDQNLNNFVYLRNFAKNCGVVAYCVQYIQNQITCLDYQVIYRDKGKVKDERCLEVEALLRRPNRRHINFRSFLNAIVKDVLLIDAVAIKPLYDKNFDVVALELIDPAYVNLKVDERGQVPQYPLAAYQYSIPDKNIRIDYNVKELLYSVYDSSSYDIYGNSALEKCMSAVRSLIKRRGYIDNYFTQGNLPENMLSVGEDMTPKELIEWQMALDAFFGNGVNSDGNRYQTKLLPKDFKLIQAKAPELQQDIDETFIREICGIFGVPPSGLINAQNKATSESLRRITESSELSAKVKYIEELVTYMINEYIGYSDLVFVFKEPTAADRLQQAQIANLFATAGILSKNEIREMLGYGAIEDNQLVTTTTTSTSGDNQEKGEDRPIGQKDNEVDTKEIITRLPNPNEDR